MRLRKSTLAAWTLAIALLGAVAGLAAARELWNGGRLFSNKPKMNSIPNTDVYYQRKAEGYDLYRYANTWFLVEDGNWYRANTWQGPYEMIEPSEVPEEVTTIPDDYQRFWATVGPADEDHDAPEGSYAWPGSLSRKPSMHTITASGVSYTRKAGDFDLYRYRGDWYLVAGGTWYRSDSWRGPFFSVSAHHVPREVLRVPSHYRRHWTTEADYERDRD